MRKSQILRTLGVLGFACAGISVQADPITFNVDASALTNSAGQPAYSEIRVSGGFNGWTQTALVDNGSRVFTNTIEITESGAYKYTALIRGNTAWETGSDYQFTLTGSPQTLPLNAFRYGGVVPIDFVTNNITFQVDMTAQGESFVNAGGVVRVSGGFNGWGDGDLLTNNPSADFPTNWWYSGTFPVVTQLIPASAPPGDKINRFKFRANGGWEEPFDKNAAGNNDRWWDATTTGDRVLPLVFYSDASTCELVMQDTEVTLQLRLPAGTIATDGNVFEPGTDTVHVNGESLLGAWQSWSVLLPELKRMGTTDIYTNTFVVPAGRPLNQKLKYSINGADNEAPTYQDHIQWIRTTNNTYVMPVVDFGTNYASALVQPQFGDLNINRKAGGKVDVTWLGAPCVTLQSKASLTGEWTDKPETDAAGSYEATASGDQQYFRLNKRRVR